MPSQAVPKEAVLGGTYSTWGYARKFNGFSHGQLICSGAQSPSVNKIKAEKTSGSSDRPGTAP